MMVPTSNRGRWPGCVCAYTSVDLHRQGARYRARAHSRFEARSRASGLSCAPAGRAPGKGHGMTASVFYDVLVINRAEHSYRVERSMQHLDFARSFERGYNAESEKTPNEDHSLVAVIVPAYAGNEEEDGAPKCFQGPGVLAIVKPRKGWKPKSWESRPDKFKIVEIVRPRPHARREFCMGFNHQAFLAKDAGLWVMVVPTAATS